MATDLGHTELRAATLPENVGILALARNVLPWSRPIYGGHVVQLAVPLGAAAWTITEEDLMADLLTR